MIVVIFRGAAAAPRRRARPVLVVGTSKVSRRGFELQVVFVRLQQYDTDQNAGEQTM